MKNFQDVVFPEPQAKEKKISLNLQQIATPPPAPKPKPIPQPIIKTPVPKPVVKPIEKPIVEKVVTPEPEVQEIKKKILDESKKVFAQKNTEENNITKVEPKPKEKVIKKKVEKKPKKVLKKEVKKKRVTKQKIIKKKVVKKKHVVKKKKTYRKPKRSKDALANMLMGSGTSMYPTQSRRSSGAGNYGDRMIKQLYGSEFNTYTPTQKKFIRNNLSTIHQITQRTLSRNGYPDIAVRTRQQGTNIVSFYLHPNGDITGLRLKKSLGYSALDNNTLKVIRLAYKDYPLPNKKTRLIFHVRYSLY